MSNVVIYATDCHGVTKAWAFRTDAIDLEWFLETMNAKGGASVQSVLLVL